MALFSWVAVGFLSRGLVWFFASIVPQKENPWGSSADGRAFDILGLSGFWRMPRGYPPGQSMQLASGRFPV
jgi:hypothetical protein